MGTLTSFSSSVVGASEVEGADDGDRVGSNVGANEAEGADDGDRVGSDVGADEGLGVG
jgi:hypothetical protein